MRVFFSRGTILLLLTQKLGLYYPIGSKAYRRLKSQAFRIMERKRKVDQANVLKTVRKQLANTEKNLHRHKIKQDSIQQHKRSTHTAQSRQREAERKLLETQAELRRSQSRSYACRYI